MGSHFFDSTKSFHFCLVTCLKLYSTIARKMTKSRKIVCRKKLKILLKQIVSSLEIADGEYSRTEFSLVAKGKTASWVRAVPTTGRTHQIRVHAQSVGHPIVGDVKYNPDRHLKEARLMLHASEVVLPDGRCFQSRILMEFDSLWTTVEVD